MKLGIGRRLRPISSEILQFLRKIVRYSFGKGRMKGRTANVVGSCAAKIRLYTEYETYRVRTYEMQGLMLTTNEGE